jgi:hypothetical protein
MAHDICATPAHPQKTIQLINSLHLKKEPDGGALVIDDRTLTVAHLNTAAYILLEAIHQPRTQEDLVTILADAANCDIHDAVAPVAQLVDELTDFGWIELRVM